MCSERTTSVAIGNPSRTTTTAPVTPAAQRSPPRASGPRSASGRTASGTRVSACSRRRRARAATASAPVTTTSCTTDSTDAARRSRNCVVCTQISVSTVPYPTPPSTSTTPNAVAQNRNTIEAADAIPGASAGSVTLTNARAGEAPRARAAWSARGSSPAQNAPTVRTTTV